MTQATTETMDASTTAPTDDQADESETAEVQTPGTTEPLPLDIVFDMLKNERRRNVLKYMRAEEEPYTLSDLAEHIAALENDKKVIALNSTERKRVYVGLYQCHLPRMDDVGVIEFDRHRGTVRTGNTEQLYQYIDVTDDADGSHRVYAGLAAVFAAGLLAGGLIQTRILPVVLLAFVLSVGAYALADHVDFFGS